MKPRITVNETVKPEGQRQERMHFTRPKARRRKGCDPHRMFEREMRRHDPDRQLILNQVLSARASLLCERSQDRHMTRMRALSHLARKEEGKAKGRRT